MLSTRQRTSRVFPDYLARVFIEKSVRASASSAMQRRDNRGSIASYVKVRQNGIFTGSVIIAVDHGERNVERASSAGKLPRAL